MIANGSADAALQTVRSEMEIIRTIAEELGSSTSGLTFEKVTSWKQEINGMKQKPYHQRMFANS